MGSSNMTAVAFKKTERGVVCDKRAFMSNMRYIVAVYVILYVPLDHILHAGYDKLGIKGHCVCLPGKIMGSHLFCVRNRILTQVTKLAKLGAFHFPELTSRTSQLLFYWSGSL